MSNQNLDNGLNVELTGDYYVPCRLTAMVVAIKVKYGSINLNGLLNALLNHPVLGDPNELFGMQYRRYFTMDATPDLLAKLDRSFNEVMESYNPHDPKKFSYVIETDIINMYWVGALGWELRVLSSLFHQLAFSKINLILREKLREIQSSQGDIQGLKDFGVNLTISKCLPDGTPGDSISLLNSAWASLHDKELDKYYSEWYVRKAEGSATAPVAKEPPKLLH